MDTNDVTTKEIDEEYRKALSEDIIRTNEQAIITFREYLKEKSENKRLEKIRRLNEMSMSDRRNLLLRKPFDVSEESLMDWKYDNDQKYAMSPTTSPPIDPDYLISLEINDLSFGYDIRYLLQQSMIDFDSQTVKQIRFPLTNGIQLVVIRDHLDLYALDVEFIESQITNLKKQAVITKVREAFVNRMLDLGASLPTVTIFLTKQEKTIYNWIESDYPLETIVTKLTQSFF